MKDYVLIEFKNCLNNHEKKEIDCVPSKWIFFYETSNEFKTPFLPPPYTTKRCIKFHEIVKLRKDPEKEYKIYTIIIKGQTGKYIL